MKSTSLKLLFCAVLGLLSLSSFSQKEVRGRVMDTLRQVPIEFASVYIQNTTIGTITNIDGKFVLSVPKENRGDTLIISSIGYKSYKSVISEFEIDSDVVLEEDIASLDEVVVVAATRPTTGNEIVLKAIEKLEDNLPEAGYMQKGFLRHRERNKKQYKWLIESALTLYDSSYASGARKNLRINVDEIRKSYDLRDVDSLFTYASYLKNTNPDFKVESKKLRRDTIETASLIDAIKWNDRRINGLDNLFQGRLNMVRNANVRQALFGTDVLDKHQFELDTVLVDDGAKVYKIRISKSTEYVGLNTPNIYNEGFEASGWLYINWDDYAIKKIEYELKAASEAQRRRSRSLFDTDINHKLILSYKEYNDKMYLNYVYYETPKLVNAGNRSSDKKTDEKELQKEKEEQFYYTVQEILFTEIIDDPGAIEQALKKDWSEDIFSPRPYNESFWRNYNVLLESEEEEKLIQDLTRRATLFKQ